MEKNVYNGWRGNAINSGAFTWLVNLHLSNDELTADDVDAALFDAIETAQEEKRRGFEIGTTSDIAERVLTRRLRDYVEEQIEDLGIYQAGRGFGSRLAADLITYALDAVSFETIAATMIEDYKAAGGTDLNENESKDE